MVMVVVVMVMMLHILVIGNANLPFMFTSCGRNRVG